MSNPAPSIEGLSDELEQARQLAIQCKAPAAAVSASLGKAKLNGLIIDKSKAKVTVEGKVAQQRQAQAIMDERLNAALERARNEPGYVEPTPEEQQANADWFQDFLEAGDREQLLKWHQGTLREYELYEFDPVKCATDIANRQRARLERGRPSTVFEGLTDNINPGPRRMAGT